MAYAPSKIIPDWETANENLREVLVNVIRTIDEENRNGASADITCLAAHDELHRYLNLIAQDMGL